MLPKSLTYYIVLCSVFGLLLISTFIFYRVLNNTIAYEKQQLTETKLLIIEANESLKKNKSVINVFSDLELEVTSLEKNYALLEGQTLDLKENLSQLKERERLLKKDLEKNQAVYKKVEEDLMTTYSNIINGKELDEGQSLDSYMVTASSYDKDKYLLDLDGEFMVAGYIERGEEGFLFSEPEGTHFVEDPFYIEGSIFFLPYTFNIANEEVLASLIGEENYNLLSYEIEGKRWHLPVIALFKNYSLIFDLEKEYYKTHAQITTVMDVGELKLEE